MMDVIHDTTPEAYREVIERLSERPARGSRGGEMREELAVLVHSEDPMERHLFREDYNLAFQLEEHRAYWEGENPGRVERYNPRMARWISEETGQLPGSAYGDRMRNTAGHDQIARALGQLDESPETRRALIAVHQPAVEDYGSNDVACTAYLHPFARDGELHMVAALRSQDVFWGYSYDAANNQWLQQAMAESLGLDLGDYWHLMDSCHYYTEYEAEALEAARSGETVRAGQRLHPGQDFQSTWALLNDGVETAVSGEAPDDALARLPGGMYRDWLGYVAATELAEHHGSPDAAERAADCIWNEPWARRAWSAL